MARIETPTFKLFSKFPLEIRSQIWVVAALEPRTYKVFERAKAPRYIQNGRWTLRSADQADRQKTGDEAHICMMAKEKQVPGVLLACWESHRETKRVFELVWVNVPRYWGDTSYEQAALFINFSVDRFLLIHQDGRDQYGPHTIDDYNFSRADLLRIQHIEQELTVEKGKRTFEISGVIRKLSIGTALQDVALRFLYYTEFSEWDYDKELLDSILEVEKSLLDCFTKVLRPKIPGRTIPLYVKIVPTHEVLTGTPPCRQINKATAFIIYALVLLVVTIMYGRINNDLTLYVRLRRDIFPMSWQIREVGVEEETIQSTRIPLNA
ncbi:hypothetical protein L207DRAFT_590056 [Hyaloscypha variabilis F]|uniref:2EXR domain-containing protein n=1 Tax=Hyaloscypha variabilis (strain UAMH 11265 / GT02V1 / F) TaxID=1149755 RepID=A0A2J6R3B4_HYAVF|nr:hypothetical protein L207DRAFT_590056 [Hyaloscypha variabilis F]